jgi:hypothetical protein
MAKATVDDLAEAAKVIEALTGVPPTVPELRKVTKRERQEQAARVKRFLALPVPLQEGCLKYAENIMDTYRKASS